MYMMSFNNGKNLDFGDISKSTDLIFAAEKFFDLQILFQVKNKNVDLAIKRYFQILRHMFFCSRKSWNTLKHAILTAGCFL